MNAALFRTLFVLFFLSGFSGLVYQIVWTRMAFASFGIITPVLSVVISVFMLGLSVGAWAGGRWISVLKEKTGKSALVFYAGAELMIGLGAFAVPKLFALGERWLWSAGQTDSGRYLSLSALVLAVSILPWCIFMGATFPLMMAYVREASPRTVGSFSFLYLANVLGAMAGTLVTAVALVELFGFQHSLRIAAGGNWIVAVISLYLNSRRDRRRGHDSSRQSRGSAAAASAPRATLGSVSPGMMKGILFSTGFIAMAMEVVWARAFTPVLKTQVYSFAAIIFVYLGATGLGSAVYRWRRRKGTVVALATLMSCLIVTVFFPVVVNDPRLITANWEGPPDLGSAIILVASICPFCAVLGYLTPGLIDDYAAGQPADAGKAYALNILGCILGPLFACYVLLPRISERYALILLGLPLFGFWAWHCAALPRPRRWQLGTAAAGVLLCALFLSKDYQDRLLKTARNTEIRRDYAASVISYGDAMDKHLLVNGMGMTTLTPITKFMVHLPLAFHPGKPESALIICFGMGTTYRSSLSWDIRTTAVELVPSVKDAFGFYHSDAARLATNSQGRIIIDDGRRYLKRGTEKFDVIVVDPPPPVVAAGSSLLYSPEFYEQAKRRLKPDGILAAWLPGEGNDVAEAVLRSMADSFPYTRCFVSVKGWGIHILGSLRPLEQRSALELAARMPPAAQRDLLEWSPTPSLPGYIQQVLSQEVNIPGVLTNGDSRVRITDDRPYNEYFLLRPKPH
jgi:spermidine synthase